MSNDNTTSQVSLTTINGTTPSSVNVTTSSGTTSLLVNSTTPSQLNATTSSGTTPLPANGTTPSQVNTTSSGTTPLPANGTTPSQVNTTSSGTTSLLVNSTTPSQLNATTSSGTTPLPANGTTPSQVNTTSSGTTPLPVDSTTSSGTTALPMNTTSIGTTPLSVNATTSGTTSLPVNTTSSGTTPSSSNATSSGTTPSSSNATSSGTTPSSSNTTTSSGTTPSSSNATSSGTTSSSSNATTSSGTTSLPVNTTILSGTTPSSVNATTSSGTTPSSSNATTSSGTTPSSSNATTSSGTTPLPVNATTISTPVSTSSSVTASVSTIQPTNASTTGSTQTNPTTITSTTSCYGSFESYPPVISFKTSPTAYFECSIQQANANLGTVEYNVTMKTGSIVLAQTATLVSRIMVSELTAEQKLSIISSGLSCFVVAYNSKQCGNLRSRELNDTLEPFNLKVTAPSFEIDEVKGSTNIIISISSIKTITIELYCILKYNSSCTISVQARTYQNEANQCFDGKEIPLLVFKSVGPSEICGATLSAVKSTEILEVHVVRDRIIRDTQSVNVELYQIDTMPTSTLEKRLDRIIFKVKNNDLQGLCRVVGDPHVFTFDNTKYDVMSTGEFVLLQHKVFPEQINGYFYRTGSGSSACAFTIRSGDDVIRVSKCDTISSQIHPISVKLFLRGTLTPHTVIYQSDNGDTFKILLPSGTVAEIKNSVQASLNIYIRPSAGDINNTEALCGVYDGNKTNDLVDRNGKLYVVKDDGLDEPNEFSRSWSVIQNESLYQGYQGSKISVESSTYCSCVMYGQCVQLADVTACAFDGKDITDTLIQDYQYSVQINTQTQTTGRKRRQAAVIDWGYQPPITDYTNIKSNYTPDEALQICNSSVTAMPSYTTCVNYSSDSYYTEILACAKDIRMTNSTMWADTLVQNLQKSCLATVADTVTLWNTTADNLLCPMNCSGIGICNKGICQCTASYTGLDCSIPVNLPPSVSAISYTCQLDVVNCSTVEVAGINFADTAVCQLTPVNVFSNNLPAFGSTVNVSAIYRNKFLVLCPITDTRSYSIRVRNGNYPLSSESANYVVYKSKCTICNVNDNPVCKFLSNTCNITGTCYVNGEVNPNNPQQICNVSSSPNSWTDSTIQITTTALPRIDNSDSVEFNSKTVIIVTGCIAGLLLIVVIVVAVVIVMRRRRMRTRRQMLNSSASDEDSIYQQSRIYDGSHGLRTDKSLMFYNPSLVPSYYEVAPSQHDDSVQI